VPAPDFPVHNNNQPIQMTTAGDSPARSDVLFTNDKGEEKKRLRTRNEKIMEKLRPALQRVLLPDEAVLYVARAQSPLSILEQLTAAWWTTMLAAAVILVTNKRILFFPIERNGSWKESVRAVSWGDLQEIKPSGMLIRNVVFKLKNGTKVTYTNVRRADGKKLAAIASAVIPAASAEHTATGMLIQICPDCRAGLTPGQYSCPSCNLVFKNEASMVLRSIFLPGGGYFYTGHPVIALIPALIEVALLLEILALLFAGLGSPVTRRIVFSRLVLLAIFWGLETAVTILHCRRYIREFIPEKRDPARVPQAAYH
jgi:hypothetical protein